MRNVLAVAWSDDGLLAMITRAAWRGPKNQVHVFDAAHDFAPLAKIDLEGDPERERGVLRFAGGRLLAHVGRKVIAVEPRSGALLFEGDPGGWVFALYPDGRAGVNTDGALRLQTLEKSVKQKLGFSAERLAPFEATTGDWAILEDGEIRRVTISGKVQWKAKAKAKGRVTEMDAGPGAVVVAVNADKTVFVYAAETGKVTATIPLTDQIGAVGVHRDGTVWVLERLGRLAFYARDGALLRETRFETIAMDAELSPDASTLAVANDLLELRSSMRVVDTTTGEVRFEPSARANKAPSARGGGESVFAKDGKLWKKGTKKPLGTYEGEVKVAMAKDGSLALLLDDTGVRAFDVKTGKQTMNLTHEKIEEETIDVVDAPLFDADGRPCVKVGKHTFVVTAEGVVSAKARKGRAKKG